MSVQLQGKPARPGIARYEIIRDPADRFIVWDESAGHPAYLQGEMVCCDTRPAALRAVERLSSTRPGAACAEVALQAATAPSSSRPSPGRQAGPQRQTGGRNQEDFESI